MAQNINELRQHIALHFHKFLSGPNKINIYANNLLIEPTDPFFRGYKGYIEGRDEILYTKKGKVTLKVHTIPHNQYLSAEDLRKNGGIEKIYKDQGIYIYRQKRLIKYGGWLGLNSSRATVSNLARVEVDIPDGLDEEWSVNVMKSTLEIPQKIKRKIKDLIQDPIKKSKKEYSYRGQKEEESNSYWCVVTNDRTKEVAYITNPENHTLKKILKEIPNKYKNDVIEYINQINKMLPVNSILNRMSSNPKEVNQSSSFIEIDELEDLLKTINKHD